MKKNKLILAAVASLAFFGMSSSAFAAWTVGSATVNVANEAPLASKTGTILASGAVTYTLPGILPGPLVGGATTNITLTLTGGAVFSILPVISSSNVAFTTAAPTFTPGSATYTWPITNLTGLVAGDTITFTFAELDTSAVPVNGTVDLTFSAITGAGVLAVAPDSLAATVIGVAPNGPIARLQPELTGVVTPASDLITVASGFTLLSPATAVSKTSTLRLQSTTNGPASGLSVGIPPAVMPLPSLATDQAVITVTGDFTGVASLAGGPNVTAATPAGAPTAPAVPGFFALNGLTSATAILGDPLGAWPGAASVGAPVGSADINLVFTFDGVTVLTPRSYTIAVAPQPATAVPNSSVFGTPLAPVAPVAPIYSATRGTGASFVLNRVGAATSIKITDTSGAAVPGALITWTAKSATGAVLPVVGAPLPTAIPSSGATLNVSGAAVVAAYGVKPASLIINVSSTDVLVTARTVTVAGSNSSAASSATLGL